MNTLSDELSRQIAEKVNKAFEKSVEPGLRELVIEYDGVRGLEVKIVSDCPSISGIGRYASIMFTYPGGLEMIVSVYWVIGSDRIVAENLSLITLKRDLNIYQITKEELKKQVKLLVGRRE
jgi:hypothetical protein